MFWLVEILVSDGKSFIFIDPAISDPVTVVLACEPLLVVIPSKCNILTLVRFTFYNVSNVQKHISKLEIL